MRLRARWAGAAASATLTATPAHVASHIPSAAPSYTTSYITSASCLTAFATAVIPTTSTVTYIRTAGFAADEGESRVAPRSPHSASQQ